MADANTDVILARLTMLSDDIGEMRGAMKELAHSVAKLALIEERQTQANEALGRAFKSIDKVEHRIAQVEQRLAAIERDLPMQKQTSGWVISAVWAAAGAAVLFVARKVGAV